MKTPDQSASRIIDTDKNSAGIFEENLAALNLSPEIKKLLLEGVAKKYTLETGGKTNEEYYKAFKEKSIDVNSYASDLLAKMETQENRESDDFIKLTVKDLGFERFATTEQVYKRAEELGLDIAPQSTGPEFALADTGIEKYKQEWIVIGMKPIHGSDGFPAIFGFHADYKGLAGEHAHPHNDFFDSNRLWLFRLRKNLKS